MKISQSAVKSARQCWQLYSYKYVDKLKRRTKKRPLLFGSIIHDMVETHVNGDDPFKLLTEVGQTNEKLFESEKEMYGEIIEDIRLIMTSYLSYWPERNLRYIRREGKSAEHWFELELNPDITIVGKIDGIAESPNKFRWLVEHKSFSRFPKDEHRWRSLQSAVYIRVVDMMGWLKKRALDGVCWDYIWSKAPTIPNVLKDGTHLSRAKIDTLPIVVLEELKKLDLSVKENAQVVAMAEESQKEYFKRIFTPVQRGTIDLIFKEFVDTAQEIVEYHGRKATMNIGFHCDTCDYEPLCRARLLGDDYDFIREREYYADTKERETTDAGVVE